MRRINWFALAGGALTLLLTAFSIKTPWWQMKIGQDLLSLNASPVNYNLNLLGKTIPIPLIRAANIASLIWLTTGGIVLLIYAFNPSKTYGRSLLGFSYKKPIYTTASFAAGLILAILALKGLMDMEIPIQGLTKTRVPSNLTYGVNVETLIQSQLQWPFWLAIINAALCIAARLYHKNYPSSINKT